MSVSYPLGTVPCEALMDDARMLELAWLTDIEVHGHKSVGGFPNDCAERRLALHLLARNLAFESHSPPVYTDDPFTIADQLERSKWASIRNVTFGHQARLLPTHAGSVRRAELEQQLKSGRIKDSMGLIWDGRHFRQDARIALLDASPARPLAVAYLDLNDVKTFNEVSHATGDDAIRRYLEIVAELTLDRGDAYRLSGGADEVVVLLPGLGLGPAVDFVRKLLEALGHAVVHKLTLRAAAGVVVATDPAEPVEAMKTRADATQGRAKAASRAGVGRPSVVAWLLDQVEVLTTVDRSEFYT